MTHSGRTGVCSSTCCFDEGWKLVMSSRFLQKSWQTHPAHVLAHSKRRPPFSRSLSHLWEKKDILLSRSRSVKIYLPLVFFFFMMCMEIALSAQRCHDDISAKWGGSAWYAKGIKKINKVQYLRKEQKENINISNGVQIIKYLPYLLFL